MIVSVTISNSRENEIADAIRSVTEHVDRVLLIDTGITDRTIERATETAHDKLAVLKHEWRDFSTARNAGIEAAKILGADWVLFIDSDERIDFGRTDLRTALNSIDADVVLLESADGHYPKEKILRATSSARFRGLTHEALIGGSRATLSGPVFSELPKSERQLREKFERDIALLTYQVATNPDPRWWYYLGASYEGIGEHALAAEAFGRCVTDRKLGNEAAWAAYKQAEQLLILGQHDEAIAAAARGLVANATFAECAWIAAVSAYRLNRNDQAIAWARIAESVGLYAGCGTHRSWFKHLPALYELPYDVLRFALPAGPDREQAEEDFRDAKLARVGAADERDLDLISVSRSASVYTQHEARNMLRPATLAETCPSTHATKIVFEPPNGYHPTNPSICWHNGELWCVLRTVNYTVDRGRYLVDDPNGVVRTENYLGRLSRYGELITPTRMADLDDTVRYKAHAVGYEDVRLVSVAGTLTGSATVCDRDPDGRTLVARLHLTDSGDVRRAIVQPSTQSCEKNWIPISVKDRLTWIYSLDPTAILPGPLRDCPFALEHVRGGAATAFQNGYLCVTHEVVHTDSGRIYLHRFVCLDAHFYVTSVSQAWVFSHHGIEFCAGIVVDGDEIVMTYGVEDREAWIARIQSVEILDKLAWRSAAPRPVSTTEPAHVRIPRIAVVNSPHERCGVREYGLQLNRALTATQAVEINSYTYEDVTASALAGADIAFVHFESSLVTQKFYDALLAAKRHGLKVVFCCHNYSLDIVAPFLSLVDRFVLHRTYDDAPSNSVEIPLGCPVYTPTESRSQIRSRLGLPEDKLVVTSLGFLAAWKQWGTIVETVAAQLADVAFLQIHTAMPFATDHAVVAYETMRIQNALSRGIGRHTKTFEPERDLIDRVYASDLGFVFHPIHTKSVSAATKQFVSGRCPLVITGSAHSSDLAHGVIRVDSFDPNDMAREIRRAVDDHGLRARMTESVEREYSRLNMDAIAQQYIELFKEFL